MAPKEDQRGKDRPERIRKMKEDKTDQRG